MKKINFDILKIQLVYLVIIAFLIIFLVWNSGNFLAITIILTVITLAYTLVVYIRETGDKSQKMKQVSKAVTSSLKDNLYSYQLPMALLRSSSDIVWQNENCKNTLPQEYILEVYAEMQKLKSLSSNIQITKELSHTFTYTAISMPVTILKEKMLLLTFVDKTEEMELKQIIENTKVTIGILSIDNFDETFQGLDDVEKTIAIANIDKTIRTWINNNKGIAVKLEKDKYAIFVEKQYIEQMEKNKFTVLDEVKNITDKTKLPITISIGFSNSENELCDRYEASNSALDIALGRGGDQVVVKKEKKFDFYGGMNLGLEKTNKVRARTISGAVCDIIDKSEVVYIMGHKNTDIDCLGAAIGIFRIAKLYHKKAYMILDNKYNNGTKIMIEKLSKKEEYKDAFLTKEEIKKVDFEGASLFVVDTHKESYLVVPEVLDKCEKVVVIDHHRRGTEFIENSVITYHELYASSTSELVTELLMYIPSIELEIVEAEAIYAGILLDTKNFTFKTGVRTFEVAAYLKRAGIDISSVKQLFQVDFDTYLTKMDMIRNAEFIDKKIAISLCNIKHENLPTIVAQAADELLNINEIVASFVLCEIDSVVMISARSMGDINVQNILEKMGGGGHITFAGAQVAGISLEQAKEQLLEIIYEYLGKENN